MWNVSAKRWKFSRNTFYWFYPKTRLCDTFLFRITLNRRLKVMVQATLLSNSRRYIKIFIEMCFYFLRTVLYITLCGCQIHTWKDNVLFLSCVYNIKPFCKKKKISENRFWLWLGSALLFLCRILNMNEKLEREKSLLVCFLDKQQ